MRKLQVLAAGILVALISISEAAAERRVALVIGNSDYTEIAALRNARNDAALIADTLTDVGFEVVTALDVNRREMGRAIRDFGTLLRGAGPDAVGLFYYAGHGVQYQGDNFLIPLGAQIEISADLSLESYRVADIVQQMAEAENALNLVVLDACRNNPFPQGTRSVDRGLARETAFSGSLVAFAAAPGQTALDGDGDNSPYSSALAEAIRTPGLSVESVFKTARVSTLAATGGSQTPWEESSLTGDFFFVDPLPQEAVPAAPLIDDRAVEIAYWNSVQSLDTISAYEDYLSTYTEGTFVNLAEGRIAELQQQVASLTPDDAGVPAEPEVRDPYAEALVARNTGALEEAAALFREAAESGNSSAMIQLASLYLEGSGVARDTQEALRWYGAASEIGDPQATFLIGRIYERGSGVPIDLVSAAQWYHKAADLGSADAMNNLGVMYSFGEGVDKNDAESIAWFSRGAEAGSVNSMFNLAAMYDEGRGAEHSPELSAKYMLDALRTGNGLVFREMTENANAWSSAFRMELQRLLQDEGYYTSAIDGSFGPGTKAAITAFVEAN